MRWAARIKNLVRNTLHRSEKEEVLREELDGFIEDLTARNLRGGMAAVEARRQAKVEAGGLEPIKEDVREAWMGSAIGSALRDVRYASRTLRRASAFSAVVLFTRALGIGVAVTRFSVMHAVLWRRYRHASLPSRDPRERFPSSTHFHDFGSSESRPGSPLREDGARRSFTSSPSPLAA